MSGPIKPNTIKILACAPMARSSECVVVLDDKHDYAQIISESVSDGPLVLPDAEDVPDGSIAVHNILGAVYSAKSHWRGWFSTERFIEDLKIAEANPSIIGHLLYVDSAGGESFMCHEAFEAVRALSKPCVALVNSVAASASYWLVAGADRIYSTSMFTKLGCIGVMSIIYDDSEYLKKEGIKRIELYSTLSKEKNKLFNDVLAGEPDEYIKTFIDPVAAQFIADIRSARKIPDGSLALEGAVYYAVNAQPEGLMDGLRTTEDVIEELRFMSASTKIDVNSIKISI